MTGKLHWDVTAVQFALCNTDGSVNETLPSLYLNIGKCHEDLGEPEKAGANDESGLAAASAFPENGYGQWVRHGLKSGLDRPG